MCTDIFALLFRVFFNTFYSTNFLTIDDFFLKNIKLGARSGGKDLLKAVMNAKYSYSNVSMLYQLQIIKWKKKSRSFLTFSIQAYVQCSTVTRHEFLEIFFSLLPPEIPSWIPLVIFQIFLQQFFLGYPWSFLQWLIQCLQKISKMIGTGKFYLHSSCEKFF